MPRKKKKLARGDVIKVKWLDIYDQTHEDPRAAKLKEFETLCYFIAWRGTGRRRQLVTSTTIDDDDDTFYGCCSFPAGCVLGIETL